MENTEQIIIAKCEELKQQLLKELVKPKFEVGKWYKHPDNKLLIRITDLDSVAAYGFTISGEWLSEQIYWGLKQLIEATESEVKDALVKEAVKRGFVEGATINGLFFGKDWYENHLISKTNYEYNKGCIQLSIDDHAIFRNGKWAEIVKEKTLDEWAEEFREYAMSDYQLDHDLSDNFKQFITKHKFQLPK